LPEAVSTPLTQIAAVQPERYLEELGVGTCLPPRRFRHSLV